MAGHDITDLCLFDFGNTAVAQKWCRCVYRWRLHFACFCCDLSAATGEEGRHSFEGTAALVSSLAILSTAYWFVFERPGVPKIDVASSAEMFPIAGKGVLVGIGVQAKNVGSTAVKFQKSAVAIISVGQVIPLPYKEIFLYR